MASFHVLRAPVLAAGLWASGLWAARVEPVALSMHPFTGQRGTSFTVAIRGNGLGKASTAILDSPALSATVLGAETETTGRNKADIVKLRIEAKPDIKPGRYLLRLITPGGLSNAMPFVITEHPVTPEPEGSHETTESAVAVTKLPAVFTGRIDKRGESDFFAFDAKAGETLHFGAISGLPAPGAPGGNARGFDPSLSVYEASGSWFDSKRINRIAFNDEPLWVLGRATDAFLSHEFAKAGRYYLRVEAFSGQGGPDYSYQLKITSGHAEPDIEPPSKGWRERDYERQLSANRLNELAARGGKPRDQKSIETYRAAPVPAEPTPFKIPGTLEGAIAQPGEAHRARFDLEGPRDLAIEIETPGITPPEFNPYVRLLNEKGEEVATTISVGRGACTGLMNKGLAPKVVVPIRDAGKYTVEIRETTSDLADKNFRYRVQVRQQVPHLGDVKIDQDHINLTPGEAKTVRVVFDREEDFRGAVAVTAESLPPGVQAFAGADYEPDKDPAPTKGKRERFVPRTERSVVVFTAAEDAPKTSGPVVVKLAVRPVVDGKPGEIISTKEIPIMVVEK